MAAALRETVRTGAYGTVWAVFAAAVAPLLTGEAPQGLSAVLTVAADCAERSGARAAIPEVDAPAARSGSS
ncbi:hypothetical protein [Streptomyces sp. NBC_01190]|uniref:hypothetical protein n=1 Tax=Streptomyces sp. NBC_01190 TaxID=2903767 RepID=UPI00386A3082|nr:hypothetical protein OG519_19735 [Streptomyces sp. NBC_01190]